MRPDLQRPQRHAVKAFTLVELLVVIAVIIILVALISPALASARRSSNQVASMNNLRQWGAAFSLSLGDNNNEMPWEGQNSSSSVATTRTPGWETAWYNRLPPYLQIKQLSLMTSSEIPRAGQKSIWINPAVPTSVNKQYQPYLFCYAMNYYLSTSGETTMRFTRVENPSACVFMAEKNDDFSNCNPTKIKAYFGAGSIDTNPDNAANFLFCDGHVALVRRKDFDPNYGSHSTWGSQETKSSQPVDSGFTFVPYQGASHN